MAVGARQSFQVFCQTIWFFGSSCRYRVWVSKLRYRILHYLISINKGVFLRYKISMALANYKKISP